MRAKYNYALHWAVFNEQAAVVSWLHRTFGTGCTLPLALEWTRGAKTLRHQRQMLRVLALHDRAASREADPGPWPRAARLGKKAPTLGAVAGALPRVGVAPSF